MKTIVGANIRAARQAKGMTQRDLAASLNDGETAVSRWERGAVMPNLENLSALAAALGQPFGWFYVDHNELGEAA